jgi:hypothetical protein
VTPKEASPAAEPDLALAWQQRHTVLAARLHRLAHPARAPGKLPALSVRRAAGVADQLEALTKPRKEEDLARSVALLEARAVLLARTEELELAKAPLVMQGIYRPGRKERKRGREEVLRALGSLA